MAEVLTRRALNRATLSRQMLLERCAGAVPETLVRLIGLQAQTPQTWYAGLWDRLDGFVPTDASKLLVDRSAVRIALMRGTIHLVTAEDCLALRPALQPLFDAFVHSNLASRLVGVERGELEQRARDFVEQEPRTFAELRKELGRRWPQSEPQALALAARSWLPLVQVTPRGVWGQSGASLHTTSEAWLGRPLGPPLSDDELVRRYLGAFGPATVADARTWSGLSTLGAAFERLRSELVVFRDEAGGELFDLRDAPRPDPETPSPARLLYDYDNLMLSHADRSRFISAEDRKRVVASMGSYPRGAVLVDGFGAGYWGLKAEDDVASIRIRPLRGLSKTDRAAVTDEARRLLGFLSGGRACGRVTFDQPM